MASKQEQNNIVAIDELTQWRNLFETYRAQEGSLPAMANGGYCLGTGFPVGTGGTANCRDYTGPGTYYTETNSQGLMTELKKAGTLPKEPRIGINNTVGPYVEYDNNTVQLRTIIRGGASDYPAPTVYTWTDGNGRLMCSIVLNK